MPGQVFEPAAGAANAAASCCSATVQSDASGGFLFVDPPKGQDRAFG
ncbi:MAG: hypothetical protein ACLR8Y_00680 [Alistipes indistinctus]